MAASDMMARHHPFVKTVAAALRRRCHVPTGASVLAAVSGGGDSVAMLHALAAIAPRRRWQLRLTVAHVRHYLRPAAQTEHDADFVAQLGRRLRLPVVMADLDPGTMRGNVEAWARTQRYRALAQLARQVGASFVVTAHQADDQLETLLMRLLRGSSIQGLSCMAWRRPLRKGMDTPALLRPLLAVDRAAVEGFLRDIGQTWCSDPTNADLTRRRARLRAQVLPLLRQIQPDAPARAVATADHLRQVAEALHAGDSHVADDDLPGDHWPRRELAALPPLRIATLLRRRLIDRGVPADHLGARHLTPILRAIADGQGGNRKFHFKHGPTIQVDAQAVWVTS